MAARESATALEQNPGSLRNVRGDVKTMHVARALVACDRWATCYQPGSAPFTHPWRIAGTGHKGPYYMSG